MLIYRLIVIKYIPNLITLMYILPYLYSFLFPSYIVYLPRIIHS